MQTKTYELLVELLEDLHSGTGTGNLLVDDSQARSSDGHPFIDRHHFRGVLHDNALRLVRLGAIRDKTVKSLFGQAGGLQRTLECSSLKATKKDCLINWESTARKKDSRCPEDNSLRRIEFIEAGTMLRGKITFETEWEDELIHILDFTTRLGSERTRGSGQIKIKIEKNYQNNDNNSPKPQPKADTTAIRLLLRSEEALCIPTSGYAGNIIHTESYIPGRLLFASLCKKAGKKSKAALKEMFSGKLQIGNAYPLPVDLAQGKLSDLYSLPMPKHIYGMKAGGNESNSDLRWPNWAKSRTQTAPALKSHKDINRFQDTASPAKRPKGEIYLVRDKNQQWRRYSQPLAIRMRNRRGDPFDHNLTRKETDLFSEQRIPEDTSFIADISGDMGSLETVSEWLRKDDIFFIGRGKSPVVIQGHTLISCNNHPGIEKDQLLLLAKTDWIIRADNLGYQTELDTEQLLKAFDLNPANFTTLDLSDPYQESETQGSYNYASQLPKRPFHVIQRGSSYCISGEEEEISELKLHVEQHPPIGERTTEGYGQFIVDLPIEIQNRESPQTESGESKTPKKDTAQEQDALCNELSPKAKAYLQSLPPSKRFPGPENWQKLIEKYRPEQKIRDALQAVIVAGDILRSPEFGSVGGIQLGKQLEKIARTDEAETLDIERVRCFLKLLAERSAEGWQEPNEDE